MADNTYGELPCQNPECEALNMQLMGQWENGSVQLLCQQCWGDSLFPHGEYPTWRSKVERSVQKSPFTSSPR